MPDTKTKAAPRAKSQPARMTLSEAMAALERAGSAQTRKTYARHGGKEPMFGVSFAVLSGLTKRIRVDHDLALALWDTGNLDARNLAQKVADPARITPAELDSWAGDLQGRMWGGYVAMLAAESSHGHAMMRRWLAASGEGRRVAGWNTLAQLAHRDESAPDSLFADALARIEKTIHAAPNAERYAMNGAVIAIGGRSAALRKAATAAAKRIGELEIDHGDTSCKTPDAAQYIEKTWAYAASKDFASPAAQERSRESPRLRC